MNRQQILLVIVGVLLLVKFGFGYINDKRVESKELLETKYNRYIKGKRLLDTESSIDERLNELNLSLEKAKEFYPIAVSAQDARLDVQRRINTLAEQSNLTVESVEWLSIEEGQPEKAIVDLRFIGEFDAMIKFHLMLEELGAWISVQEMGMNVRQQKVSRKRIGTARGSMLFEVFYIVDGR